MPRSCGKSYILKGLCFSTGWWEVIVKLFDTSQWIVSSQRQGRERERERDTDMAIQRERAREQNTDMEIQRERVRDRERHEES